MRLVYITDIYPKLSETFITREIGALRLRGAAIELISIGRPRDDLRQVVDPLHGVGVHYVDDLSATRLVRAARHALRLARGPLRYQRAFRDSRTCGLAEGGYLFARLPDVCSILRRFRTERVHCHFAGAGAVLGWCASRVTGLPFSVTLHGTDTLVEPLPCLGRLLAAARNVVCVSHAVRDRAASLGAPADRLHVIPCGVDTGVYAPPASRPDELRLLCVARMHPIKGLQYLIEACALLRDRGLDYRCTIVGDGSERAALARQIDAAGLGSRITLAGARANWELPEFYASHTMFVLPSLSEGMGVVLTEAMATGLPVVASNVGGIPELVQDGIHGRLVPPRQPAALADAVAELAADRASWPAIAERNRRVIQERFDLGREADRLFGLFGAR